MLTKEQIQAFEKEWFSAEEIQAVIDSEKHFEKTWESYDLEESRERLFKQLFNKYVNHA